MTDRFANWTHYAPTPKQGPSLPNVVPSHLRGRRRADPEPGSLFGRGRTVPRRARGWSGTRVHGGRVSGYEDNPELRGAAWFADARRMRTDDAIDTGIYATMAALMTARWSWAPGDPEHGFSRQLADEVAAMWARMRRPWSKQLYQALAYLFDGARYAETLWGIGPTGQIDVLDAWLDREMTAHDRWVIEGDDWLGVYQRYPMGDAAGPDARAFIPADELTLLTHGVSGMNLDGRGILRSLWHQWKRRVDTFDMTMAAQERWHQPVPVTSVNTALARELGLTPAEIEQQIADVEDGIFAFVTGDAASMRRTDVVGLETFGGDIKPSDGVANSAHIDSTILRRFLLQMLTLGGSSGGSFNLAETHKTMWRDSLLIPCDDVAEAFSGVARPGGGVAGRWVELNYGEVHPDLLPKLEHSGLSVDPLINLVQALDAQKLSLFGIGSTRTDKDALRRRLDLDPLPEPEDVPDEDAGIDPADDDGEPDLPVKPGNYSASNGEAADLLGISTASLNRRVRKSLAIGLGVPAIGSGRDRRWDLGRVQAWYHELSGGAS